MHALLSVLKSLTITESHMEICKRFIQRVTFDGDQSCRWRDMGTLSSCVREKFRGRVSAGEEFFL